MVVQLLTTEEELTVCAQVKILRNHFGEYLGLPWAPGYEQLHHLSAEGGICLVNCFVNVRNLQILNAIITGYMMLLVTLNGHLQIEYYPGRSHKYPCSCQHLHSLCTLQILEILHLNRLFFLL